MLPVDLANDAEGTSASGVGHGTPVRYADIEHCPGRILLPVDLGDETRGEPTQVLRASYDPFPVDFCNQRPFQGSSQDHVDDGFGKATDAGIRALDTSA
jgi:hypothetical protein